MKKIILLIILFFTLLLNISSNDLIKADTSIAITDGQIMAKGLDFFNIGDTIQLNYFNGNFVVSDIESCINKDVTWESSDTSVATVSENGLVTIVGYGSAQINAFNKDKTDSISIRANSNEFSRIILYKDNLNISIQQSVIEYYYWLKESYVGAAIGSNFQLKYRNEDGSVINTKEQDVVWRSSEPEAVSVDGTGLVNVIGSSTPNKFVEIDIYLAGHLAGRINVAPILIKECEIKDLPQSLNTVDNIGVSISGIGEQLVDIPNTSAKIVILAIIYGVVLLVIGIGILIYIKNKRIKN